LNKGTGGKSGLRESRWEAIERGEAQGLPGSKNRVLAIQKKSA